MTKGIDYTGVCIVFVCHDGQGNFAMLKRGPQNRDEYGTWGPGAGGLKFGEKLEDALKREIRDEYGVEILNSEPLGFREIHREHEGVQTHWLAFDYKVLVDRDKVYNAEPAVHSDIGWYTVDTLPDPVHSQMKPFVDMYYERLR